MKIYIAGPYTKGDVAHNVKNAIFAGNQVAERGHTPFIPHLTHFWHLIWPHDYAFWLGQDAVWLVECDAVLRIPGDSVGADQEIEMARGLGKIIYLSLAEVPFIVRGVEFNRKES